MESDRRSSFLFGRIFFDEPVSTSSENALDNACRAKVRSGFAVTVCIALLYGSARRLGSRIGSEYSARRSTRNEMKRAIRLDRPLYV